MCRKNNLKNELTLQNHDGIVNELSQKETEKEP
jgi:hypothetical protein